jgi:hypothetical protein
MKTSKDHKMHNIILSRHNEKKTKKHYRNVIPKRFYAANNFVTIYTRQKFSVKFKLKTPNLL